METVVEVVKTYAVGGPGRKQCSSCNKYVAARSARCVCGVDFVKKTPVEKAEKPEVVKVEKPQTAKAENVAKNLIPHSENIGEYRLLQVTTPQGGCPVKLEGTDFNSVSEWAMAVREVGYKTSRSYTTSALSYYVREFYDIHGIDHETVIDHLYNLDGKDRPVFSSTTRFEPLAETPVSHEIVHYETETNEDSVLEDE